MSEIRKTHVVVGGPVCVVVLVNRVFRVVVDVVDVLEVVAVPKGSSGLSAVAAADEEDVVAVAKPPPRLVVGVSTRLFIRSPFGRSRQTSQTWDMLGARGYEK